MFRVITLIAALLLSSCTSYTVRTDDFGKFLIKLSDTDGQSPYYSFIFKLSPSISRTKAHKALTLRATSICSGSEFLIRRFQINEADSPFIPTVGGRDFYAFTKKAREASAEVVCQPTSEQIADSQLWDKNNSIVDNRLSHIINQLDEEVFFGVELFELNYSLEKPNSNVAPKLELGTELYSKINSKINSNQDSELNTGEDVLKIRLTLFGFINFLH